MTTRSLRSDALPENKEYHDKGCNLHPRCLNCPLPDCRHTGNASVQGRQIMLAPRNAAIVSARRSGAPINDICDRFQLGKRAVSRVLASARKGAPWPTH